MALIDFKPGRFHLCIAFVYGRHDRDWLCAVYRDADAPWRASCRFRYYAAAGPADPFSGADRKNAYDFEALTGSPEDGYRIKVAVRKVVAELLAAGFNDRSDWVEVNSADPAVAFELLRARPWAHLKAGS